ncbi:MAG TPA: disulfide bond formation protein B [Woeseiaceae bacterium]|nr:disulfide bond formation protein B [Woeseiaceae bacterium]
MTLDRLPSRRVVNFAAFAVCCGLMGFALFAQHVLLLDPCPLCVFQRVAVISMGLIFLVAALHDPAGAGRIVYGLLLGLAAIGGASVAGRHAWLQQLPPDQVPSCGPGLDYMLDTLPFTEVLGKVFRGSGECAEIVWQFLGLSMPGWVLVWVTVLGVTGILNNVRRA